MKNLLFLGLLISSTLIYSQQKNEVVKNNHSLVEVLKKGENVELIFIPISYNKSDVKFHDTQKINLSIHQYTKFVEVLKLILENKKDIIVTIGDYDISFDYEKGGTIYSNTKLGKSFLNFKPKVRFSVENSEENSIYLTQDDIQNLII